MSVYPLKSLLLRILSVREEIDREQRRPSPDGLRLLKLKTLYLGLRDRAEHLTRGPRHAATL